jgi:hypothetical protein
VFNKVCEQSISTGCSKVDQGMTDDTIHITPEFIPHQHDSHHTSMIHITSETGRTKSLTTCPTYGKFYIIKPVGGSLYSNYFYFIIEMLKFFQIFTFFLKIKLN